MQIGITTNAAASGVVGIAYDTNASLSGSAPTWTNLVDEGQQMVTVAPSSTGHVIYRNVEIYPELLWRAGSAFTVRTRVSLDAGAIAADDGTDITIFAG